MSDKPEAGGKGKESGFQIPGTKIKVPPKILLFGGIALVAILVLTRGGGGGGGGGEAELPSGEDDRNNDDAGGGVLDALKEFGEQQRERDRGLLDAILGGFQGLIPPTPISDGGGGGWTGGGGDVGIMPPPIAGGFPVDSLIGGDSLSLVDAPIVNELGSTIDTPSGEKGSLSGQPKKPASSVRGKITEPTTKTVIDPKSKTVQTVSTKGGQELKQEKAAPKTPPKPTITAPKTTVVKAVDPKSKTIVETKTTTKGTESGKVAGKGTGVKTPTPTPSKPIVVKPPSGGKVKGK